jgi:hypothetical protein
VKLSWLGLPEDLPDPTRKEWEYWVEQLERELKRRLPNIWERLKEVEEKHDIHSRATKNIPKGSARTYSSK